MIIFGPVPSRRLGRSLGINNISYKNCSYSCVYCQVGRTNALSVKRKKFYDPEEIYNKVGTKLNSLTKINERVDYITLVPDGEPTLDINLGLLIEKLKTYGYNIAVITNASLIGDKSVQSELMAADLVSLKIDSVDAYLWRKINRPHGFLNFDRIKNSITEFALKFKGILITETMLVEGYNDNINSLSDTAQFIRKINPSNAYIMIPTRPPAEDIHSPGPEKLESVKQILISIYRKFDFIDFFEGTNFTFDNNFEEELLDILSVHPIRKKAVEIFLKKADVKQNVIQNLIKNKIIKEIQYNGFTYLIKLNYK